MPARDGCARRTASPTPAVARQTRALLGCTGSVAVEPWPPLPSLVSSHLAGAGFYFIFFFNSAGYFEKQVT